MVYHGVPDIPGPTLTGRKICYPAGAMVRSKKHPNRIIYRSPQPVLVPEGSLEIHGTFDNVLFPTGVDRRDDLGTPARFDVYYGMADDASEWRVWMCQQHHRRTGA
jgi:beta-1,2-mannobiose phosphorylase / 1,2-beta-oligomannan phosphorylase